MMLTNRFWNIGFFYIILILTIIGILCFFILQGFTPQEVGALILIVEKNGLYLIGIILLVLFSFFIGLQLIYKSYIRPIKTICAEAEIIYSINSAHRIESQGNRELQNIELQKLIKLINNSADMFDNLNQTVAEQTLISRKEAEKEKNLLAAIMSEFPHGVIACNKNGRILLFNSLAKSIFTAGSSTDKAEIFLSLGRSVFHILDKSLILHAVKEIEERLKDPSQNAVSCFITPIQSGCLIYAEAIPVLNAENQITGFILVFHDVSHEIDLYEKAYNKLISMNKDIVENEPAEQQEVWKQHYNDISGILLSAISSKVSLSWQRIPDFLHRIRQNPKNVQDIQLNFQKPIKIEASGDVQIQHKSPAVIMDQRPEFYDLDLFNIEENDNIMDSYLTQLNYTVFDTETTGLKPDGGDEIISIAAVRIVNSKIIYQGKFDELVNPKRDIPPESYRIHGISYDMVSDKDDIKTIMPLFKQFAEQTVLMGHNVAFDMKMFQVKEKETGIVLYNPVLDTLLLSAALHPIHTHHTMEDIAKRLGVDILGRHTALGDAIATAQIFSKMLPLLNNNGILTLRDAIKASKKTYYARLQY